MMKQTNARRHPSPTHRRRKHVGYGVAAAHYDVVGQALLDTLAMGLGDAFTDEVRAAWVAVYGVVSSTMQAGAEAFVTKNLKE